MASLLGTHRYNPADPTDDGYRIVADATLCVQCQGKSKPGKATYFVVDAHGDTIAGPMCSHACGVIWLNNFRAERMERRQSLREREPTP